MMHWLLLSALSLSLSLLLGFNLRSLEATASLFSHKIGAQVTHLHRGDLLFIGLKTENIIPCYLFSLQTMSKLPMMDDIMQFLIQLLHIIFFLLCISEKGLDSSEVIFFFKVIYIQ